MEIEIPDKPFQRRRRHTPDVRRAFVTLCPDNVVNVCKAERTLFVPLTYFVVNAAALRRTVEQGATKQPNEHDGRSAKGARLFWGSGPSVTDVVIGLMEEPLKPSGWIDGLERDPLHEEASADDLVEWVTMLEFKRQKEAIHKASLN